MRCHLFCVISSVAEQLKEPEGPRPDGSAVPLLQLDVTAASPGFDGVALV